MDLEALITETVFLGEEFATWLWFACETREGGAGEFDLGHLGLIEVALGDDLVLTGDEEDGAGVTTLRRGSPAFSAEAKAALTVGKKVSKCKLTFSHGKTAYTFTLDATRFAVAGLKLPRPEAVLPRDVFLERQYGLAEVTEILDALLQDFLAIRLSPDLWPPEVTAMRNWIAAKPER